MAAHDSPHTAEAGFRAFGELEHDAIAARLLFLFRRWVRLLGSSFKTGTAVWRAYRYSWSNLASGKCGWARAIWSGTRGRYIPMWDRKWTRAHAAASTGTCCWRKWKKCSKCWRQSRRTVGSSSESIVSTILMCRNLLNLSCSCTELALKVPGCKGLKKLAVQLRWRDCCDRTESSLEGPICSKMMVNVVNAGSMHKYQELALWLYLLQQKTWAVFQNRLATLPTDHTRTWSMKPTGCRIHVIGVDNLVVTFLLTPTLGTSQELCILDLKEFRYHSDSRWSSWTARKLHTSCLWAMVLCAQWKVKRRGPGRMDFDGKYRWRKAGPFFVGLDVDIHILYLLYNHMWKYTVHIIHI